MRKFLGIRFIGYPFVSIYLTAFSLLLGTPVTEAMPQKVSNQSVLSPPFIQSSNPMSSKWAFPSSSCFSRTACLEDANFQQEFRGFVNFVHSQYPSAHVPSAERLQRHACNMLAPGSSYSSDDLEANDLEAVPMGQWLATSLSYSFWNTQVGMNPYPTSPVWWCFLDNSSRYIVTDTQETDGVINIIATFSGLGKPLATGGAGYYVSKADITDAYPAISLEPGFYGAQTYTNKELVAIDLVAPGTTKALDQYQLFMKIQAHDTYPRRTIALIQETVNKLAMLEWQGLCSVACTNCAPGEVCS